MARNRSRGMLHGKRRATLDTFNPSGIELDGTKAVKAKSLIKGKDGRSLRSIQQSSLSHRDKKITLPKLPPLREEEEK